MHNNDPRAFDEIYAQFHQKVYQFMLRCVRHPADAQELTQQLFVRLWEKRSQLATHKPLDGQIFVIARNLSIDELRKKARLSTLQSNYQIGLPAISNCTEEQVMLHDLSEQLDDVIDLMPRKRGEIFRLSRKEGLSYREIAERLSISVKTVENQMSKALQFVKVKMTSFLSVFL